MSDRETALRDDRANRNAARRVFTARLGRIKGELTARGVGGRIADSAGEKAAKLADEGLAVARESKGVIAATGAALLLWMFRGPLGQVSQPWLERAQHAIEGWFGGLFERKDD